MDTAVQIAIIAGVAALISAIVTGILAPHINWWIEKKKERLKHQRELIDQWRELVKRLNSYNDNFPSDAEQEYLMPKDWLQRNKAFYSLKPHLRKEAIQNLDSANVASVVDTLIDEIARIEIAWGLAPVDKVKKFNKTAP